VMRHQWERHYRRRPIDHGTRLDETMGAAASAPGEATVEYENSAVNSNGWEFSVVEGSIGSRVSGSH